MSDFTGKAVLVTGAAGGIGYAIAHAFAQAGASVVGIDHAERPGEIPILHADLLSEPQFIAAVSKAATQLGKIDVLVNCAGTDGEKPLASFAAKDFDRIFGVNVRAMILVAREALKHMGPGSRIVKKEVANAVLFLSHPNTAYITGQCLSVDGGAAMHRNGSTISRAPWPAQSAAVAKQLSGLLHPGLAIAARGDVLDRKYFAAALRVALFPGVLQAIAA